MSKYVFCDLDNTLLDNNREISKENYEAINAFEAKGNHFIICSGRVPFALKQYKERLASKDLITSNGAVIFSNNKVIKQEFLSKEIMFVITNYAIENNINVRYYTNDLMYILNQKYAAKNSFLYKENIEVDSLEIFNTIDKENIIKLVLTSNDNIILKIAQENFISMNLDVEISFSSDIFLEVNAIKQNKGNGVLEYCKINNIDIKDTVSIGDNDNDISMLQITGFSACPSNSIEEVKRIVDYVCISDNNHNAIKEVLEKIG